MFSCPILRYTINSAKTYSFTDDNPIHDKAEYRLNQENNDGTFKYSSILTVNSLPTKFELSQNFPNPFNPTTMINFALPVKSDVTLSVYNSLRQKVATLINGNLSAGNHSVNFDASNLSSGIYIYLLNAGYKFTDIKKMILMK